MKPKEIKRSLAGLQILWTDQKAELISYAWLRAHCSCAVCRETKTTPKFSDVVAQKREQVQSMELVGNYAVSVAWADGHRGIFAYERLKNHDLQSGTL
jgi:DUF971 family protein